VGIIELVTSVINEVAAGKYRWPGQARNRLVVRRVAVGIGAVVLIALLVAGLVWWFAAGTFLHASAGGYGRFGEPEQQYSFGVQLETVSGPSVVLDGASASYPKDLQVKWAIYRNGPGQLGFGMWNGELGPRWPTVAVHGYRVSQPSGHPEQGATWLVGSVRASKSGVYSVSDIKIRYRSGLRTRRVSIAGTTMCLLAAPPADRQRLHRQLDAFQPGFTTADSVDPLVARYEACSGP
jgi:hypothetical protein